MKTILTFEMPQQTRRFTIMTDHTEYQYFAGQWFNCSYNDFMRIKISGLQLEVREFNFDLLMNGKKQISLNQYEKLHEIDQENYRLINQIYLYGLWIDSDSDQYKKRKVYREK